MTKSSERGAVSSVRYRVEWKKVVPSNHERPNAEITALDLSGIRVPRRFTLVKKLPRDPDLSDSTLALRRMRKLASRIVVVVWYKRK